MSLTEDDDEPDDKIRAYMARIGSRGGKKMGPTKARKMMPYAERLCRKCGYRLGLKVDGCSGPHQDPD